MAILSKGTTYADGDQITSTNLNALVDSATFAAGAVESGGGLQLNGSGQLKVAGNVDIGTSNLTATGSISLGATTFNDNNITNVGSIAVDTIIADNTDVTIDAAGDIILDADGAQVRIKDDGTERFIFNTGAAAELDVIGTSVTIHSNTSDADIIFKGNDGGSSIDALTLDMSAAGAATFNDKVIATELDISGDIDVDGTTNLDAVDIDGAVDMATTLAVAGNVDFNGDLDVDGTTNLDAVDIDGAVDMASTLTVAGEITANGTATINRLGLGVSAHASAALNITTTNQHIRFNNGSELGIIDLDSDGELNIWAHGDGEVINLRTGSGVGTDIVKVNSTGIDVTGTAKMDGLNAETSISSTVSAATGTVGRFINNASSSDAAIVDIVGGNTSVTSGEAISALYLSDANANGRGRVEYSHQNDSLALYSAAVPRLNIANNGDISFYEDTGSTAKLFWDASAESLGIGTTSPDTKLAVSGGYISQTDGTRTLYMGSDGTGGLFGTTTNHYLRFITNNSERLRIDSSGLVGIGTSSPTVGKLQVNDGSGAIVAITRTSGATSGNLGVLRFGNTDVDSNLANISAIQDGSTTSSALTFETQSTGGATAERLRIDSSGQLILLGNGGSTTNSLDISYNGTSGEGKIQVDSGGGNTFLTLGTSDSGTVAERLRITSAGNVGIGTGSSITTKLEVKQDADTVNDGIRVLASGSSNSGNLYVNGDNFVIQRGGQTNQLVLDNSGNVSIGGTLSCVLASGVTATTQSASDNSTKVATTAYVDAATGGGSGGGAFSTLTASGDVTFEKTLALDRPSDAWSSNTTWLTIGQGGSNDLYGTINTGGSYAVTYNGNGYRKGSSQWESFGVNSNTGATQIWQYPAGYITFNANSNWASGSSSVVTELVRIDGVNGYVGINDSTPSYRLDVNGNARFTSTVRFDGATQNFNGAYDVYRSGAGYLRHRIADQSLYLGVTNTAGTVHYPIVLSPSNDVLQFNNEEGEMARFDTSGNLGIGETSPDVLLHVGTGSIYQNKTGSGVFPGLSDTTSHGFMVESQGADGSTIHVSRTNSAAGNFSRQGTGDVVVFRNTSGSVTEAGSVEITGATSVAYRTSSDYRLKENVVDVSDGIDRVKQLNPVRFNFIGEDPVVDGFLAHEVQDVVPEAIGGEKDAMKDEEYEVSPAVYEDVVHPAVDAVYEDVVHPATYEEVVHPAVEATYDEDGNELTPAVEEYTEQVLLTEEYTEQVLVTEAVEEYTESVLVTEAVMGTRTVPKYQGIDQSKLVPLLTAALQEAVAKIEALEARVATLEG